MQHNPMSLENLSPMELWNHPEFIAGHSAGAAWWTKMLPGVDCPKPPCPYATEEQRKLWERGFEWGEADAESSYYQD